MIAVSEPAAVAAGLPAAVADRTGHWLLHGPAQLRQGPHAGAVAGCLRQARALYVYPEITGYYLQWLAWRARDGDTKPPLSAAAWSGQRWLARWLDGNGAPQTRVHLDAAVPDWRNEAVFCFDIAMVARGLASASAAGLLEPDPAVVAGLVRQLERLVAADGVFGACLPNRADAQLPARWSTRRGPYLAKAAAGLLVASRTLPGIPPRLVEVADATFAASLRWFVDEPHDDIHPLLYACEGILSLPRHPRFASMLPVMGHEMDRLLHAAGPDGVLPETLERAGVGFARVDVLAQALRAGVLLGIHRPEGPPDRLALERIRHALVRQMQPEGAFRFALRDDGSPLNVWTTMFGDQALHLAAAPQLAAARRDDDPLLV